MNDSGVGNDLAETGDEAKKRGRGPFATLVRSLHRTRRSVRIPERTRDDRRTCVGRNEDARPRIHRTRTLSNACAVPSSWPNLDSCSVFDGTPYSDLVAHAHADAHARFQSCAEGNITFLCRHRAD